MIGYLALARDTFDINYALDNKKKFEKWGKGRAKRVWNVF